MSDASGAQPDDAVVVLCTFPSEDEAATVATAIVEGSRAACVNILGTVRSIYRWQGATCDERETLAMFKTTRSKVAELTAELVAMHSYDTPEVIAMPVVAGSEPYLAWVRQACSGGS